MEIIKREVRRNEILKRDMVAVLLVRASDGQLRLVYEFIYADPGHFHDANNSCSLYGNGTRVCIDDASIVPPEFAEIRFRQALATV